MNIGDIYVVNFEPSNGSEIRKIRPAVILQNKIACIYSPLVTIVPLSSKQYSGKLYEVSIPTNTENNLAKDSVVLINQISTYDKKRIYGKVGHISSHQIQQIFEKLDLHFGRL